MINFASLSAIIRALFALWVLLLCLTNIANAVLATVKKRYSFLAFAVVLFVPCHFIWQVIFDYSLFGGTNNLAKLSASLCELSVSYWLVSFVILSIGTALLFAFNIKYDRTYITPGTIKLYLDKIPCGICCWRENGRVLFSNICMNSLCAEITGNTLLNGNQFSEAVNGKMLSVNDKVWRFVGREMYFGGERLYEMIASDITAEYAKTQALEKDKAELSHLNQELWEYYLGIDESVQHQEILQAKMNIHDEMNRLMLSTVAADKEDTEALNNIFSLWEQNALLLCMEADKKRARQTESIDSLANALGIDLVWENALPKEIADKEYELFSFTAKEAVVNAVKHAQAKQVRISFEKSDDILVCRFSNDGKIPKTDIHFAGGLANLAVIAQKQGASLESEIGDEFSLILKISRMNDAKTADEI